MPVCNGCDLLLTDENWYSSSKKFHVYRCKKCKKAYSQSHYDKDNSRRRALYANDPEYSDKTKARNRNDHHRHKGHRNSSRKALIDKNRLQVITKLGGKCVYCGISTIDFLTRGHKYDNGAKWRLIQFGNGQKGCGAATDGYLLNHGTEDDWTQFQIECYNCNLSKRRDGWNLPNNELNNAQRYRKKLLIKCFVVLGGQCVCCGDKNLMHSTLGHKNDDGAAHRKAPKSNPIQIAREIVDGTYSGPEIQLECFNCNMGKQYDHSNRVCPHKRAII